MKAIESAYLIVSDFGGLRAQPLLEINSALTSMILRGQITLEKEHLWHNNGILHLLMRSPVYRKNGDTLSDDQLQILHKVVNNLKNAPEKVKAEFSGQFFVKMQRYLKFIRTDLREELVT